ncbi:hypothetical protein D3C81_1112970 [compost metagenome]
MLLALKLPSPFVVTYCLLLANALLKPLPVFMKTPIASLLSQFAPAAFVVTWLEIVDEKVTALVSSCSEIGAFWQELVTAAAAVARNKSWFTFIIKLN